MFRKTETLRCQRDNLVRCPLCAMLFALACSGCTSLPPLDGRTESSALAPEAARQTRLGQIITPSADRYPAKTGILPLANAREAFATRMRLSLMAEQTLDVQYYIWRADTTGLLLLQSLSDAANRGVRVRLLLDDMNTAGLDPLLRAVDAQPNMEVRLFNPFVVRTPRFWGFLTDFSRLNRRMHNKSFTADNQATVVGGRNVGDEYFGATDDVLFSDLDVLAIGAVVGEVSNDFDRYWSSASAYPAPLILGPADDDDADELAAAFDRLADDPETGAYLVALNELTLIRQLDRQELPITWTQTRMVSDDPAKGLDKAAKTELLASKLKERLGDPKISLDLVSPYFIPGDKGTALLSNMAERGITIRILTNSLSATDVATVHSGYARYRKTVLEAGIQLYEMKARPSEQAMAGRIRRFGSSATSLHAKTFAVDRHKVFVGSFNFDPRSATLNTELGFLIQSPSLANEITKLFDNVIPQLAYEVRLDDDGDLYWIDQSGAQRESLATEPETSAWKRFSVGFFSWLPIEGML